jgi:hypothetical protein
MRNLAARRLLSLAVSFAAVLVILSSCDEPGWEGGTYRDLGDGLVMTPGGQVVEIWSLPEAVTAEEIAFWSATNPAQGPLPPVLSPRSSWAPERAMD